VPKTLERVLNGWVAQATRLLPSGDAPNGTAGDVFLDDNACFQKRFFAIPVGESPTGTVKLPVPPIFNTRS
jgi:hypothetical protein